MIIIMSTISKDTPLAELTLRRYEKPYQLSKRDLVKKLCLTLGLLQPGDSRDVVVDVLFVVLQARKDRQELSSEEVRERVEEIRRQEGLPMLGVAPSNIRRQLKRLRDIFLAEKVKNRYRMTEFESLDEIFEERIASQLLPNIMSRVKEYLGAVDDEFG